VYSVEAKTTSDRIAQAALKILAHHGPDAVTMRRVAQAVGITPMAIYHHFPNREALLDTITEREFAKFTGYLTAVPPSGSLETRYLNLSMAYVEYALDHPRVFEYVFSAPRPGARRFPEDFKARRSPSLNLVADATAAAMAKGLLRKDDVWEVAFTTTAHTHGYITLYLGGRIDLSAADFRALVRRSLRRLLHGLKA
jgi:AcrR family transcriptional regulator